MTIIDAIRTARTKHVVYFLLAAYVETLGYYDPLRSSVPPCVHRLPIAGTIDVAERLHLLREVLGANCLNSSEVQALLQETVDVFDTATLRLRSLDI